MTLKLFHYANELMEAEETKKAIQPFTERDENLTVRDAYYVQLETVKLKENQGKKVIGKKIGLTSKAMQQLLNVNEPDYGHLFDDMEISNGSVVNIDTLISPRVEAEIGFVLKEDLKGSNVTFLDVIMATDYVVPTLEIIDSRIADWKIKLEDTVADNGSSAKVVVGNKRLPLEEINLRTNGMILKKNNEIVGTGAGSAALGHPAEAIAWLANKLSEFNIHLKKGELILPGALAAAVPVGKGDIIEADFGILGSVSVSFE